MTPAAKTATEMPGRRPSERLLAMLGGVHVSVDVAPGQRLATADVIEVCQALADANAEIDELRRLNIEARDEWANAVAKLDAIRAKLAEIVCTEGCDAGVVMLSSDGPTHPETHGGRTIQVYDHEYFSPLGDALMELWKMTDLSHKESDNGNEPSR